MDIFDFDNHEKGAEKTDSGSHRAKKGEGFNFPRLDTLMLAAPVSFEGRLEQYRFFDNMYAKRLRTHKRVGFSLISKRKAAKQTANAIYDSGNYGDVFERDLVEAEKSIVVSSSELVRNKVDSLCGMEG